MIPGSNLLNMALTIIAKQTIIYYRDIGRILNDVGQNVTIYDQGTSIVGSFQPVSRKLYEVLGLDLQKDYFNFYTSNNLLDVSRDVSGDQIVFNGERYQCESNDDWYRLDGWKGVLCVRIGLDSGNARVWGFNQEPSINSYVNFENGNFAIGGRT